MRVPAASTRGTRYVFRRTEHQSAHEAALAGDRDGKHGQKIDRGHRHHLSPQRLELRDEGRDADRHGLRGRRAGNGQRDDEFVPGNEKAEQRRDPETGQRQRDHDAHEDAQRAEPVDASGLDQFVREIAEEAGEDPDHQRQHDGQVADDQPERIVDQPERAKLEEEGQRQRDRREDAGDYSEGQQRAGARIGEFCKTPGGRHRQQEA